MLIPQRGQEVRLPLVGPGASSTGPDTLFTCQLQPLVDPQPSQT